jgi:hypothetical protein
MRNRHALLIFFLGLLALPGAARRRSSPASSAKPYVVSVRAPVLEEMQAFLFWCVKRHPSAIPWYRQRSLALANQSTGTSPGPAPSKSSSGTTIQLPIPTVDLYAPSGSSIYYSKSAAKNAKFLRSLPEGISWARAHKPLEIRPTLRAAMGMLRELKPYAAGVLAQKRYVIFAVSLTGAAAKAPTAHERYLEAQSKIQNAALQEFERRARRTRITVISVQLGLPSGK